MGAAYAEALARRGFDLVLIARREQKLNELQQNLIREYGIKVLTYALDLSKIDIVIEKLKNNDHRIDLFVYNAAFAPIGDFIDTSPQELELLVNVNIKAPLLLTRFVSEGMIKRQKGGIILMSSMAGTQGSPKLVSYAASKAFNAILAEGLWGELRSQGIDVLASVAGAIRTPGYAAAQQKSAPGTLDADTVAEKTLKALGKKPVFIPGLTNKIARFLMGRLLPRKWAIAMMRKNTETLS